MIPGMLLLWLAPEGYLKVRATQKNARKNLIFGRSPIQEYLKGNLSHTLFLKHLCVLSIGRGSAPLSKDLELASQ